MTSPTSKRFPSRKRTDRDREAPLAKLTRLRWRRVLNELNVKTFVPMQRVPNSFQSYEPRELELAYVDTEIPNDHRTRQLSFPSTKVAPCKILLRFPSFSFFPAFVVWNCGSYLQANCLKLTNGGGSDSLLCLTSFAWAKNIYTKAFLPRPAW